MSFIRKLIDRCYGGSKSRITIAGNDYTGKTTLLYLLTLQQFIQVHPTIGFNVEEFYPPTMSGGKSSKQIIGWDTGIGCGSLRHLLPLLAIYAEQGDALVWVVDSNDKERLSESADNLQGLLDLLQKREAKNVPILVLANKQDLPNVQLSLGTIRLAFAKVLSGKMSAVFPTSLTQGLGPESGLPQAFDWLDMALSMAENSKEARPDHDEQPLPHEINTRSPGNLGQKLNNWLGRAEKDSPPDEFLSQFDQVNLPSWDHYVHIRIAFLILTKYGRQKGKDMIFDGIKKYLSESKNTQTSGRNFHITMTYFWIQIVHFGIQNAPTLPTSTTTETNDSNEAFSRFLIVNPHVVDGQLWSDYYSRDCMMGQEARVGMVLPDKKPLPSVATRDHINKLTASS